LGSSNKSNIKDLPIAERLESVYCGDKWYCRMVWAGQHPSVSDRLYSNNPHQGVILAFKPHPSDNGTRQITATYCAS